MLRPRSPRACRFGRLNSSPPRLPPHLSFSHGPWHRTRGRDWANGAKPPPRFAKVARRGPHWLKPEYKAGVKKRRHCLRLDGPSCNTRGEKNPCGSW